jgi:histidine triad (HIT) family protein
VHQDEQVLAFHDLSPAAPTHLLVIPRRHLASLADVGPEDAELLGRLVAVAAELARERQLAGGFRVVLNAGPDAGQSVDHLHLHLLGGRAFSWPPG